MASFMTPSPKTRLYSRGALSGRSTCSTATESVAAKITPSASESCACLAPQPLLSFPSLSKQGYAQQSEIVYKQPPSSTLIPSSYMRRSPQALYPPAC